MGISRTILIFLMPLKEATKLMKHSKRPKLSTEDINQGLQLFGIEALYGHGNISQNPKFVRVQDHKDLFYLENKDLDFGAILSGDLPVCPKESSVDVHWLAIEGIQPDIPQNLEVLMPDSMEEEKDSNKRKLDEFEDMTGSTKSFFFFWSPFSSFFLFFFFSYLSSWFFLLLNFVKKLLRQKSPRKFIFKHLQHLNFLLYKLLNLK